MKKPAVFLDRDGTINEQMGYINHLSRFNILPGVPEAIKLLNNRGFLAIIVSNQSGVARGYFPMELVGEVHSFLMRSLKEKGAGLDGIFFCPHHPRGAVAEYRSACECRKPRPGLIDQACEKFDIEMSKSYMIGDRYLDMELAHSVKIGGIMVETGYGLGDIAHNLPKFPIKPVFIAQDLLHAVRWIVEKEEG